MSLIRKYLSGPIIGFICLLCALVLSFFINDLGRKLPFLLILYCLLFSGAILSLLTQQEKRSIKGGHHLIIFFIFYSFWLLIEPYISSWFDMSRLITYSLFLTPATFFVCSVIDIDRLKQKIALGLYFSFGSLLFLWGLLHFIAIGTRPSGPLTDTNVFAGLLLVFILPVLVYLIVSKAENKSQKKTNDYLYLYLTLGVCAFFSSDSRSAMLALIILVFFIFLKMFLYFKVKYLNRCLCAGFLLIAAFLLINFFAAGANTVNRAGLQDIANDKPIQARLMLWETSLDIYKEHPVTGIGFGQFKSFYRQNRNPLELESTGEFVHNDYLQFLLEGGFVQLLFFAWLSLIIIYLFFKNLLIRNASENEVSDFQKMQRFTALCLCCVFFIQAMANFIFYVPVCAMLLGALLAIVNRADESNIIALPLNKHMLIFSTLCATVFIGGFSVDLFVLRNIPIVPNISDKDKAANTYSLTEKLSVIRPKSLTLYRHRFLYKFYNLFDKDINAIEVSELEDFDSALRTLFEINESDALTLHYIGLLAEDNPLVYSKLKLHFSDNKLYSISPRQFFEKSEAVDTGIYANYFRLHRIMRKAEGTESAYHFLRKNYEKKISFKELGYREFFLTTQLLLEDAYKLGLLDEASEYANKIKSLDPCNEFVLKSLELEKPDDCP